MTTYAIIVAECSGIPITHVSSSSYSVDTILWSGFFSAILSFISSLQQSFPDRHHLDDLHEDYSISTRDLAVSARRHIPSSTCILVVGTPEDEEELKGLAETALNVYMSYKSEDDVEDKWKKEMIRILETKDIPDSYFDLIKSLLQLLDGCQAVAVYSSDGLRLDIVFIEDAPISLQESFEEQLSPFLDKLGIGEKESDNSAGLPNVNRLPDGTTILSSRLNELIILAWCKSSYEGMNRLRFKRECLKFFGDEKDLK